MPDKENGNKPAKILLPFELMYYDRKKKMFFNRVKDVSPKLVSSIERYITAYSIQQYMEDINPGKIYYVSKNLSANLNRSAQLQLLSSVIEKSALLTDGIAQKYADVNSFKTVYNQASPDKRVFGKTVEYIKKAGIKVVTEQKRIKKELVTAGMSEEIAIHTVQLLIARAVNTDNPIKFMGDLSFISVEGVSREEQKNNKLQDILSQKDFLTTEEKIQEVESNFNELITQYNDNKIKSKDRKISNHGKEEYKPDYKFIQKAIKNNKIVYVNKEKSATLADTIRNDFPLGSDVSNALSDFIVSPQMQTVKTENDLMELQSRFTNLYQFEQEVLSQAEEVRKQYTNVDGTMKEGWHKAPTGKESNLTEKQYCIVRTPAFKEWFGDWEITYKQKYLRNGNKFYDHDLTTIKNLMMFPR